MEGLPPPGTGLPDHNRGPEILAVCGSLTAVSFIFVAMRFFVRARMTKNLSWDDWTILAAWIVVFVEMMLFIPEVYYGAGRHAAYIQPPSNISKGLKLNFVTQPLCMLAITLVKVSIGLFLLRLTPTVIYRRIIQVTMALTCAVNFAYIVILFNQCKPLPTIWGAAKGTCMKGADLRFATFFNACFGIVTDLILALIPVPMLYKLQINWKVRLAVCCVLSLGLFAASAAAVKVYFTNNFGKKGDFLWDSTDLTIWTTVEICVAVIACSIPSLKPLFKAILTGSSYANTYPNQSRSGYMQQGSSSRRNMNTRSRSSPGEPGFEMYNKNMKSGSSTTASRKDKLDPDNISEESFLPVQHQENGSNGAIRKTVQVSVHSNAMGNPRVVEDRV